MVCCSCSLNSCKKTFLSFNSFYPSSVNTFYLLLFLARYFYFALTLFLLWQEMTITRKLFLPVHLLCELLSVLLYLCLCSQITTQDEYYRNQWNRWKNDWITQLNNLSNWNTYWSALENLKAKQKSTETSTSVTFASATTNLDEQNNIIFISKSLAVLVNIQSLIYHSYLIQWRLHKLHVYILT